jgi:hypothetical protein
MSPSTHPCFSGVMPHLAQVADLGPPRSEIGVGCLMPFAGKLYVLNYSSHRRATGTGTGLRVIEADLSMTRHPAAVDGTYANRMVHHPSNQLIIGPHLIDPQHRVRTVPELIDIRLAGTSPHLSEPARLVYMLGMEGELFELDVHTLACTQIADLQQHLGTEGEGMVHFKDCFTNSGRLVVCSNEYMDADFAGARAQGRLAEWKGSGAWTVLERKPYVGLGGIVGFGGTTFAIGWDRASALLSVHTASNDTWTRYRLPKASHCFDHKWQTEWPRVRSVEHERLLLDCHGTFYELSPHAYAQRIWGVRPVGTHLTVVPDFCSWRGLLVMGSDNASADFGGTLTTAEPQSGIWMGRLDDLWQLGKPAGWGGPWWDDPVHAGQPSDPFLMTGFGHKCLHLSHTAGRSVSFDLELDALGTGRFQRYATLETADTLVEVFPPGLSAHWARLVPRANCTATAQFHYT